VRDELLARFASLAFRSVFAILFRFFFKLEGDANERARARKVKVVKMPASRAKQTEHN
jgi:hypothetical protein